MQPHEQRVIDEKKELDEKRTKLTEFINGSEIYKSLGDEDKRLLNQQLRYMDGYAQILELRIERFNKE